MNPRLHDPGVFFATFVAELARRGRPAYPCPEWWRALERGIAADEEGRICEIRQAEFSAYDASQWDRRRAKALELESRTLGVACSKWLRSRRLAADWH